MEPFYKFISFLLSGVSRSYCPVCRVPLQTPLTICDDCLAKLAAEAHSPCPVCHESAAQCLCGRTNLSPMPIFLSGRTWLAHTWYRPVGSRDLTEGYQRCTEPFVLTCKKRYNPTIFEYIADQLAADLSPLLPPEKRQGWYLTYPPRSDAGYREYGFDQCEEIVSHLSHKIKIPVRRMLKRVGGREQKKMRDAVARAENMEDAFVARRVPEGCRVLLFDDIITTGATMRAAGHVLVEAGATAIFPVAFAATRRGPSDIDHEKNARKSNEVTF